MSSNLWLRLLWLPMMGLCLLRRVLLVVRVAARSHLPEVEVSVRMRDRSRQRLPAWRVLVLIVDFGARQRDAGLLDGKNPDEAIGRP
jgi:hypothetical protein